MVMLINIERAKIAFPNLTDDSQDAVIASLIASASKGAETWCKRRFGAQAFDEIYDSDGSGSLLLKNFPVLDLTRLALAPVTVLTIKNANKSSVARAFVRTVLAPSADWPAASAGITLTRVTGGQQINDATIFWTTALTVQAVADAINLSLLPSMGWTATVLQPYGIWSSTDINAIQGAYNAFDSSGAQLTIHATDLTSFTLVPERGEIQFTGSFADIFGPGWVPYSFSAVDILPGVSIPRGFSNLRCQYVAGFNTVPEDVQEAVALWTAGLYQDALLAGEQKIELLGDHSLTWDLHNAVPKRVQALLAPYRDHRV
jgi:hypothetical protein